LAGVGLWIVVTMDPGGFDDEELEEMRKVFKAMDSNDDGYLERNEIINVFVSFGLKPDLGDFRQVNIACMCSLFFSLLFIPRRS
jgi:hypothetical protein